MIALALAVAMNVALPNGFTERDYQRPLMRYLDNGGKRAMVVWPRRHGKDLVMAHQECKAAHRRRGAYWHFFPTLEQGRRSLWEAFTADGQRTLEGVFPGFDNPRRLGSIVARKNEQQMFLELRCGSIWRLMGTDKIESVGAGPVGVTFSEYALSRPRAWDFVRPMLRENDGWAAFITTPRGNNHARQLFDVAGAQSGWYRDLQTVYTTAQRFASAVEPGRLLSPDEMMAEERAAGMPEALIRQEYLCDWSAANVGAVFGDLVPVAQSYEHPCDGIYTSWDLGVSDATAIWFWRLANDGVDFIDHYEATGKDAAHFIRVLDAKPYAYVRHYLPHDARNRTWVTSQTPMMAMEEHWPGKVEVLPQDTLANGVEAGRWLLQRNTRFHVRCAEGVEALRAYHYEWDEDRKTLGRAPVHDWSSHSADAFRYAASVVRLTGLIDAPKAPEPPLVIDASPVTFAEIRDSALRAAARRKRNRV